MFYYVSFCLRLLNNNNRFFDHLYQAQLRRDAVTGQAIQYYKYS